MTTVRIAPLEKPTALYRHANNKVMPTYLQLNLQNGALEAIAEETTNDPPERAIPGSALEGRVRRWLIPLLTAEAANALLTEAGPLAQRILNGVDIRRTRDSSAEGVATLNDDARAADDELDVLIQTYQGAPTISEMPAATWHADEEPTEIADDWGITASSDDAKLDRVAVEIAAEIEASADATYVPTGVLDYLREVRDGLRDAVRAELSEVADQRARLTARRDKLIRRIRSWDVDSDRSIGMLAGVSHTQVQNIAKVSAGEGAVVREIADRVSKGHGLDDIADDLNARGVSVPEDVRKSAP
ncbi:hypothetical protein BDK92_7226 [Micromonospora pisi]|uniref:Uncharacterized protein n=2 Tax=Micromonospora pisi TaxID=589240 RepID=A0A495JUQ1_9ACTN|nr:hypothetical protein BDK92_7226 [Micromonospora pisi]